VVISAELQLKAWVVQRAAGSDATPTLPRRMCDACREFCRTHPDREVPCGQPGCTNTWTFKTGAQLQDFVAGRSRQPMRPCPECSRALAEDSKIPARNDPEQVMPCVVIGCAGTWIYRLGTRLEPANEGSLPLSRMCAACRTRHGASQDVG
jgi:hypothetical protein